jgi:hypothetical protein
MKKCSVLLVLVLLCRATPVQAQASFAGTWDSTFGPVVLTQKGKEVSGTYYDGKATLKGTVEKNELKFTYVEPFESGEGLFKLSADGKSFTGSYLAKGAAARQAWNGTFKGAARPARAGNFTGTWATTFGPVILTQKGKEVSGTYYDGKATLRGTAEGNKMKFDYVEAGESGEGLFEMSADGKSFTGSYLAKGAAARVAWNGTRK